MAQVERSFVVTPSGRLHIASSGFGAPVLLLHQTPRSWDEFRDVLPLLGRHYRVIAMDTVGYGDSDPLPEGQASIENWAKAAHQLLAALGISRAAIIGHHTGAAIGVRSPPPIRKTLPPWFCLPARTLMKRAGRRRKKVGTSLTMQCRASTAGISPNSGRCAGLSIRPIVLISWSDSSSMPLKPGHVPPRGIASLIAMKWKPACHWCAVRRSSSHQPRIRTLIHMPRRLPPRSPAALWSRLKMEWCLYQIRSRSNSLTLFTASWPPNRYGQVDQSEPHQSRLRSRRGRNRVRRVSSTAVG
jgi:hypothetical protein